MLDFDFSKLASIAMVALVVLGPERLPRVARMAGAFFGRARRYADELKSQVTHEMELDELHPLKTEFESTMGRFEHAIDSTTSLGRNPLPLLHGLESSSSVVDDDTPATGVGNVVLPDTNSKRVLVNAERRRNWRPIRAGLQNGKRLPENRSSHHCVAQVRSTGVRSETDRQSVRFV